MNFPTPTFRRDSYNNLSVETAVDIGDRRELTFRTSKSVNKVLRCRASVSQVSEDGSCRTHAIGFGLCGDFSTAVGDPTAPGVRATEKSLRELHDKRIAEWGQIIVAAARDWYASGRNVRS